MLSLIIGGSASGKSAFAEQLVTALDGERWYLATLLPMDEECLSRIARHRLQRSGGGFRTLESPALTDLSGLPTGCNVLLEDLGNLVSNVCFPASGVGTPDSAGAILQSLDRLSHRCRHLTIVGNDVFSAGGRYDPELDRWLQTLALVQREVAIRADLVVEMVCGRPVIWKGALP